MDKDILFLLAIRKREHKVSTNKQYTHSALVFNPMYEDVMPAHDDLCARK